MQCLAPLLDGGYEAAVVNAETGSGKTLCELLPWQCRYTVNTGSTPIDFTGYSSNLEDLIPYREAALRLSSK